MRTWTLAAAAFAATLFAVPAVAAPVVTVSVGLPTVVVAPLPPPVVVVRPARPGPNYVWVEPGWRADAYGRRVFVAGHWSHRPNTVTVVRRGPPHRTVVVRR